MNIRKGDTVEVIAGDDAGKTGKVTRLLLDKDKLVVEGINRVYRHMKPSRRNAQGGRLSKEMPVSVSNVLLYCATCRRGTRTGRRIAADGSKERYCKKCGGNQGLIRKPKIASAG